MADSIRYIDGRDGYHIYPVTHERAVMDSNGVKLETKLGNVSTQMGNISTNITNLQQQVNGLSNEQLIVAWDGTSSPVAASIPSAATVIYNNTPTDGSLAPSASTLGNVYLVSTGTDSNYQRYATAFDGTTYSWITLGALNVDLSDYVRKDSEVWLTEDQFEALSTKDPNIIYNVYEEVVSV